jgi:CDGSH-type Zn-finger protein
MFGRTGWRLCSTLPIAAGVKPIAIDVKGGQEYYWCSCGASKTQPFCDGSHKALNKARGTAYKSVKFVADKDSTVYFCACKRTTSGVTCDGSHNFLTATDGKSSRDTSE